MSSLTTTYSHAAPYIRLQILNAVNTKMNAKTQRKQREYTGQMFGLTMALDILMHSPEGEDSPAGYPDYHGGNEKATLKEIERFLGGPERMFELGFYE